MEEPGGALQFWDCKLDVTEVAAYMEILNAEMWLMVTVEMAKSSLEIPNMLKKGKDLLRNQVWCVHEIKVKDDSKVLA